MGLSCKEKLSWLQLVRSDKVGPITFYSLLKKYGTAQEALYAISQSKSTKVIPANLADIEKEMNAIEKMNGTIIAQCEPEYPKYLKLLKDAPPLLTTIGAVELLNHSQQLAIVGSRQASYNSYKFTQKLSFDIAQAGFVIISGLAKGIDTAAHNIIYQNLPTIAVVANGINVIYPQENKRLYDNIVDNGGLIITEFPYGSRPKAHHFPQRNRIIAGLSLGVLVVEASLYSGSLITAKYALSQDREVLVVPGSPLDFRCKGSNQLLKEGATLVDSASDVLLAFSIITQNKLEQSMLFDECSDKDKSLKSCIIKKLSYSACNVDELINTLSFELSDILVTLSELEIEGKIERSIDSTISLKV